MAVFAGLTAARALRPIPNNALIDRASQIVWGADDLHWVGGVWPPVPVGIAAISGSSVVGLAIIGAICSGGLLHALAEQMVLSKQPWWLVVLTLTALTATPIMAFLATADLSEFLTLVLVTMAMSGFLRFVMFGRTEGGFEAGLLLGLATACNIVALAYAIILALAGPLLAHHRHRGHAGAASATIAVIAFPALAAAACWAFLEWRFTGGAFQVVLDSSARQFWNGFGLATQQAGTQLGHILLSSPLYLVAGAFLVRRSPLAALGYLFPLPGLMITLWFGLQPPSGMAMILLSCLAILVLPTRPKPAMQVVIAMTVVAQWLAIVAIGVQWSPLTASWWMHIWG